MVGKTCLKGVSFVIQEYLLTPIEFTLTLHEPNRRFVKLYKISG